MTKSSRIVATTVLGAVFGVICMLLSKYTLQVEYWPLGVSLLLHHTVMGFAIGASVLAVIWALHGVLWGALFGLFLVVGGVGTYPQPWVLFVLPVVWGFLIETLATKVFKQAR